MIYTGFISGAQPGSPCQGRTTTGVTALGQDVWDVTVLEITISLS